MDIFDVDLAALGDAGHRLDLVADQIGSLRPDAALSAAPAALPATATGAAVDDLALRITTALAAYAVQTHSLGSATGATVADYAAVDSAVEESIRRLYAQ